jgi:multiple sugar transport system ATP-binding protein
MASVELKKVSKVFRQKSGAEIYALNDLSLIVADKELVVLVGPSGCGKTTTLRLIAGLEEPSAGAISIGNIVMNEVRPQDRDVAMVFQRDALYPHMTVFENMAFGLELRQVAKAEIETRVKSAASTLGIPSLLDRHPRDLSGGQRQRAALGRAVVRNPKVLLLDEPLSNLDAPLRTQMRAEISRIHRRVGTTMLYVTHDQAEAMTLGGRVAVMREGAIQQIADPITLYHQPADMFVAGFIGSPPMNLFRGRVVQSGDDFIFQENNPAGAANGSRIELPLPRERGERLIKLAEGNMVLGVRPENIALHDGVPGEPTRHVTVEAVEPMGFETHVHFSTGAQMFIARMPGKLSVTPGERVPLLFDMSKTSFFHPVSGTRLANV